MSSIIYIGKISGYLKEKCYKRFRKWEFELYNDRGVFVRFEGGIQRWR